MNSRYYDPRLGRFVNTDDVNYLGVAATIPSYNLYTYCENDCINFIDYFGHTPSLSTLTRMHNAVIQSAMVYLLSVGTITTAEVRTCNGAGKYNGRMDIYSYITNRVWEVKRNNSQGITAGINQLNKYTSSYVYSLYHSRFCANKKPKRGSLSVYGSTIVGNYYVTYRSHSNNKALIVYDYMTLDKAVELLLSAITATKAALSAKFSKYTKKLKEKALLGIAKVAEIALKISYSRQKRKEKIKSFLKTAGPIILLLLSLIIFAFTGVPVIA